MFFDAQAAVYFSDHILGLGPGNEFKGILSVYQASEPRWILLPSTI